jgi:hypothetical protein
LAKEIRGLKPQDMQGYSDLVKKLKEIDIVGN